MNPSDAKDPFFDLLNDDVISPRLADLIFRASLVRDVPARTYLQQVADDPGGMWGLKEGALAVEFAPGRRDPQLSYLLLPPLWLGEGSIIANIPRLIGVSTTRRSFLLHLPAQRFFDIASEEPLLWRWAARVSRENFERAMRMTDALMVRNSDARIAAVLIQLGGSLREHTNAPRVLDVTQTQLAAIANVSRSILNPVLKTLESQGVVELGNRTITIVDPVALGRAFTGPI
jgi:CRP/FNR family transcriptional regulator, cyclic AMP receptor protein